MCSDGGCFGGGTNDPYWGRTANGVLQSSFCAIWQIVATHVGFVLFGKISEIRVTYATIFHNSDKSLITLVLFRVISPIHVYFFSICTNSSKKLDRSCAILYQIAQTHLELMLFQKIVTNHTSVFVLLFCKIAETHLEFPLFFKSHKLT